MLGVWQSDSQAGENSFGQHVTFAADGTWSGSLDGCNQQSGKWVLDASSRSVVFEDMASTLMGCVNPGTGEMSPTADAAEVGSSKITLLDGAVDVGILTKVNSAG